jgi:beta-glucosidase
MTNTGSLDVSIDVTNTGKRAGEEVVQLYAHQQWGSASRPVRELKGFQKVSLAAGETKSVHFKLRADDLKFWSPQTHQWSTEASTYDVWVGGSSAADVHDEFQVRPASNLPSQRRLGP